MNVAPDRRVDPTPGLDDPPDERHVFLLDFPIVKLPGQFLVGAIVFGDDHQSRGPAIEPVHDSRPCFPAYATEILYVMQQRIHDGSSRMAGSRVNHHPRGFIEDHDVGIFVDDAKRERLWFGSGCPDLRKIDHEAFACPDWSARPNRTAGRRGHAPILDETLNLRTRVAGKNRGQEMIETQPVMLFIRVHVHRSLVRPRAGRPLRAAPAPDACPG